MLKRTFTKQLLFTLHLQNLLKNQVFYAIVGSE